MGIPERFEKLIKDVTEKILSSRLDIKALVIIGSVAKGDYTQDSDVDIVCIIGEKLNRKQKYKLMESIPEGVQLVPLSEDEITHHFKNSSTMAHAIQKGMVLYEKDEFLYPFLKKSLQTPSKKWMKEWFVHWLEFHFMGILGLEREKEFHEKFCKEGCHCFIPDNLARAAVNFAILYLEAYGIVPVSKGEIKKGIASLVSQDIFKGLELGLAVCHEYRTMSYDEALKVEHTATWLKQELIKALSISKRDMEKSLKIYDLLKGAEKKPSNSEKGINLKRENRGIDCG